MDEAHNVLAVRERVSTFVMHEEGVRHPYMLNYVGLFMLNLLMCVKASMQVHKRWMPKDKCKMPCKYE